MKIAKIIFASGSIGFIIALIIQQIRHNKLLDMMNEEWNNQMDECIKMVENNTEEFKKLRFERAILKEEERKLISDLGDLIEQLEEDS